MTIRPSGGLGQADVDRLVAEARAREPEDKSKREQAGVVRQLDGLVANTIRSVQVLEGKLTPDESQRILELIGRAKKGRGEGNLDELKVRLAEMEKAAGILGQAMLRPTPNEPFPHDERQALPPPFSAEMQLLGTGEVVQVRWRGEVVGRFEPSEFETIDTCRMKQRGHLVLVESPAAEALLARLKQADHRREDAGLVEIEYPSSPMRAFLSLVSPTTGEALLVWLSRPTSLL